MVKKLCQKVLLIPRRDNARYIPTQLLKFTYWLFGTKQYPLATHSGSVPLLCRQVANLICTEFHVEFYGNISFSQKGFFIARSWRHQK